MIKTKKIAKFYACIQERLFPTLLLKDKQYFQKKALQKFINCGYETTVNRNLLSLKTLIKQETLLIHIRHNLEILIINRI